MMVPMYMLGAAAAFLVLVAGSYGCSHRSETKNALAQTTGEAGSTIPKSHPPYYPNTAGNIVAPPGNPAGNGSGSPPIVGGTQNQEGTWPEGR